MAENNVKELIEEINEVNDVIHLFVFANIKTDNVDDLLYLKQNNNSIVYFTDDETIVQNITELTEHLTPTKFFEFISNINLDSGFYLSNTDTEFLYLNIPNKCMYCKDKCELCKFNSLKGEQKKAKYCLVPVQIEAVREELLKR